MIARVAGSGTWRVQHAMQQMRRPELSRRQVLHKVRFCPDGCVHNLRPRIPGDGSVLSLVRRSQNGARPGLGAARRAQACHGAVRRYRQLDRVDRGPGYRGCCRPPATCRRGHGARRPAPRRHRPPYAWRRAEGERSGRPRRSRVMRCWLAGRHSPCRRPSLPCRTRPRSGSACTPAR